VRAVFAVFQESRRSRITLKIKSPPFGIWGILEQKSNASPVIQWVAGESADVWIEGFGELIVGVETQETQAINSKNPKSAAAVCIKRGNCDRSARETSAVDEGALKTGFLLASPTCLIILKSLDA
jgi:hypothetical protein